MGLINGAPRWVGLLTWAYKEKHQNKSSKRTHFSALWPLRFELIHTLFIQWPSHAFLLFSLSTLGQFLVTDWKIFNLISNLHMHEMRGRITRVKMIFSDGLIRPGNIHVYHYPFYSPLCFSNMWSWNLQSCLPTRFITTGICIRTASMQIYIWMFQFIVIIIYRSILIFIISCVFKKCILQ